MTTTAINNDMYLYLCMFSYHFHCVRANIELYITGANSSIYMCNWIVNMFCRFVYVYIEHALYISVSVLVLYSRTFFNILDITHTNQRYGCFLIKHDWCSGSILSLWMSKVLANQRRRDICKAFSHWLRPSSALYRKRARVSRAMSPVNTSYYTYITTSK